ncbi:histidine kinase N-terminal 7TM domain-containing protein, partial [Chloroflexota bacterium]
MNSMNLWALIPILSCTAYLGLLLSALRQFKNSVNRVFAFFLFASFSWSLFAAILSFNPSASSSHLIFWNNMLIWALVWSFVTYYHFTRIYTGRTTGSLTYVGYAGVLVIIALSFGDYVVRDAGYVNGIFYHDIGPWLYILLAFILPTIASILVMLIKKYRASKDNVERNRIKYLIFGLSIAGIYGSVNANIPLLASLPTDHLGTLANAIIIGFVIRKYQLLDIGFVARRALVYSILA